MQNINAWQCDTCCGKYGSLTQSSNLRSSRTPHEVNDPILAVSTQAKWEAWLKRNGDASSGVWLRIARKGADEPTVSYAEALECALCFGWIDGRKRAESEHYWLQRFTPRAARSAWSKINKAKAFFATLNSQNRYAVLFRI